MCFLIPFAAFYSVSLLFLTCEDIENLNGMAPIVKKIISTSLAPKPIGPYNQVVIVERTVYLSGVVGVNVSNGKLVPGGVIPETIKALENIQSLLRLAGSHVDNVIKCTVLLKDINDFSAVNQEYTKVFTKNFPARTCYQAGNLPMNAVVEIEVIAIAGDVVLETVGDGCDSKL